MTAAALVATAMVAVGSGIMLACAQGQQTPASPTPRLLRYVALGDSYTIGTSVVEDERWPNRLAAMLDGNVQLELVANLGVNGASSADLIRGQLPKLESLRPEFATLLIGVNDVVRGVPLDRYQANVEQILDALVGQLPPDRVLVVSTPDYTLTPMGSAFGDPDKQRAAIAQANGIMQGEAAERAVAFVDISPVANRVASDPALVAGDGLHPSGIQYAAWAELIAPVARQLLSR